MHKLNKYMGAMSILLFMAAVFLMVGCAPYASYDHMSHPRVSNDGFDLLCVGGERAWDGLELHAGVCKDATGYREEYVRFGMRYTWDD